MIDRSLPPGLAGRLGDPPPSSATTTPWPVSDIKAAIEAMRLLNRQLERLNATLEKL